MSPAQLALLILVAVCLWCNWSTEARLCSDCTDDQKLKPVLPRRDFRWIRESGAPETGGQLEGRRKLAGVALVVPREKRSHQPVRIIKTVYITRPSPKNVRIQEA